MKKSAITTAIILSILSILSVSTLSSCVPLEPLPSSQTERMAKEYVPNIPHDTETLSIASFNIQVFGKTKAGNPETMAILADIISQFDIVAIQEIRDKSGTAMQSLESAVDAKGVDYEYIIGPRLGRTTSKEQYAYIYRTASVEPIGEPCTYPDDKDLFHREPFIAGFKSKSGNFDFILISIHTDPDEARTEIPSLDKAVTWAQANYSGEKDFIILGDLNSDCTYYQEGDTTDPLLSTNYAWLIDDSQDTTVSKTDCTYDRIIITRDATSEDWTGKSGVYRFDTIHSLTYEQAKKVSDHYPVWAIFHTSRDTN